MIFHKLGLQKQNTNYNYTQTYQSLIEFAQYEHEVQSKLTQNCNRFVPENVFFTKTFFLSQNVFFFSPKKREEWPFSFSHKKVLKWCCVNTIIYSLHFIFSFFCIWDFFWRWVICSKVICSKKLLDTKILTARHQFWNTYGIG